MTTKWKPPFWIGDRLFSQEDIDLIFWTAKQYPDLSRTELACTICENLDWKAPNGKERFHSCLDLQDMADWLDTKDVTLLVDSIVQSRNTGTSLASVLEAQSIRMRDSLRTKATEQAQKAPIKMVFPLMLCILPSLMVITIGPPMMKLRDIFVF